ncbi:MAG: restriction endonuclease subunit S, partial [Nitrospirae bacterium]|nr:restriction endonuclease subunit S [Fimbriimonadaceae bacterium]
HHPSRWESKAMLEACRYPLVKLKDLVCERNEMLIPARNLAGSIIRYTGLAHIESETGVAVQSPTPADSLKSGVRRYEPGDILFAKMRPNLRKVALASFEEGGYASPECAVLTVRQMKGNPIVDPLLLSVLLRTDFVFGQILHHVAGIGRPRIGTKELREVLVPLPPLDVQARMRAEFLKGQNSAAEKQRESEELLRQATAVVQDSVRALVSGFTGVH